MEFIARCGRPFNLEYKQLCRHMINYMRALMYFESASRCLIAVYIVKHIQKIMMHREKKYEAKKYDPIIATTNLFGDIINIHSFEDENGRICCLILVHVLMWRKCSLLLVVLSSLPRRGKKYYTRKVKIFVRKPSNLYTMILKSLIHCWDNFE